jgi:hypothetical protein
MHVLARSCLITVHPKEKYAMSLIKKVLSGLTGVLVIGAAAATMTGCGAEADSIATGSSASSANRRVAGNLRGGNQPVVGSVVSIYAAGTGGYGSGSTTPLATTISDGNGSFGFTQLSSGPAASGQYVCPSAATQLYILAKGGATQGFGNGVNSAAAFAVAIGPCSSASTVFVNLNEVTSTATMAALQQYFNPVNETFGYPNRAQAAQGFINGVAMISNLVTLSAGAANTGQTVSAIPNGSTNTVAVTITPEYNQINTIANILASCVNTSANTSSNCANLFAYAVPPTPAFTSQPTQSFTTITPANEDTLQAVYFMLTNFTSGGVYSASSAPTSNMAGLYALIPPDVPFQPYYSSVPTDWTIGVTYSTISGTGSCTINTPSTSYGTGSSATQFLLATGGVAVDATGNIWGLAIATGGLYELSPAGIPLACTLGTAAIANVTSFPPPVIDDQGYIWASTNVKSGSNFVMYKVNSATAAIESTWTVGTVYSAYSMGADGSDNIFYSVPASGVFKLTGAAAVGASSSLITSKKIANITVAQATSRPTHLAVDSAGDVWVAMQNAATTTPNCTSTPNEYFYLVYPSTGTGNSNGYLSTNLAAQQYNSACALGNNFGLAVGSSNVYTASSFLDSTSPGNAAWTAIVPGSTPGTVQNVALSSTGLAGMVYTTAVAVDGASNVWSDSRVGSTGQWNSPSSTTAMNHLDVMSSTGVALSASSPGATTASNTGGIQKPSPFLPPTSAFARGIAVDPTGNVWFGTNAATGSSVSALVGAAVPVVTPISVGVKNGSLGRAP